MFARNEHRLPAADLGARLRGCADVPAERRAAARAWTDAELASQGQAVARVLRTFAVAVAAASGEPEAVHAFLAALDLRLISRDHDWRGVFAALKSSGRNRQHDKSVAIRRYLEYLGSRKDLIDRVRADRDALADTGGMADRDVTRDPGDDWVRLRPGIAEPLQIPYRGACALRLGHHEFQLRDGFPPVLVDPDGRRLPLARGRRSVGRHVENDVVVDRCYARVSRAHLLVDWQGGQEVRLTDLSSLGTFVERIPGARGRAAGAA